jgi:hypothetical protein
VATPILARIAHHEVTNDDSHGPPQLEVLNSAPGLKADFAATSFKMEMPVPSSEATRSLVLEGNLAAEAFKPKRFKAGRHPAPHDPHRAARPRLPYRQ